MKHLRAAAPFIILAVIVLLAAGLRAWDITAHCAWNDEISSLEFSAGHKAADFPPPLNAIQNPGIDLTGLEDAGGFSAIWHSVDDDTHPPLHPLLLRVWRELFGGGDGAARSLSLVCSLIAVILLFDAARTLHGTAVALWAAAIMAVASSQIVFAQEIRSYSMLTMFLLGAIAALVRIEKFGATLRRAAALGLVMLLAMLTHYAALPAGLALGIYSLAVLRADRRRFAAGSLAAAAVVFLLVCGPLLWHQRGNFSTNLQWLADPSPGLPLRTLGRLASLPLQFFFTPKRSDRDSLTVRLGLLLFLSPLLVIRRRDLLIWILVGGAVIGTTVLSDLLARRASLEVLRFTVLAAPAAFALVAAAATSLGRRWLAHAIPAAIVVACLAAVPEAYNQYWKPDYREFARRFDQLAGPNDLIIARCTSRVVDWQKGILVAATTRYSKYPHRPMLVLSEPASPELLAAIAAFPGAWYLSNPPAAAPEVTAIIPGAIVTGGDSRSRLGSFSRISTGDHASTAPDR